MAIEGYAWPGNIRELENRIKRAVIMANGSKLTEWDLQLSLPGNDGVMTLKKARDKLEKNLITLSLSRNNMNLTRAAAELGISRPTLYELMNRLGVKINQDS